MRRRPLTPLEAWRLDGEFRPHSVQETLSFVSELQDVEDEWVPPPGVITFDAEPRWVSRLRSWFGR
jgi:hypothetical protein